MDNFETFTNVPHCYCLGALQICTLHLLAGSGTGRRRCTSAVQGKVWKEYGPVGTRLQLQGYRGIGK